MHCFECHTQEDAGFYGGAFNSCPLDGRVHRVRYSDNFGAGGGHDFYVDNSGDEKKAKFLCLQKLFGCPLYFFDLKLIFCYSMSRLDTK